MLDKQCVLIMTSVVAEKEAIEAGLKGDERFHVRLAGVGPVEAAVATTMELSNQSYNAVVNMGIAGGFEERAKVGSLVVASKVILADLGVQTEEEFKPVESIGFGQSVLSPDRTLVDRLTRTAGKSVLEAPVLTMSTVTGTSWRADELRRRYPDAAAEAMEGFGVGFAALKQGLPFMEIRAISNAIGPRDRDAWRMQDALLALTEASHHVKEMF
ncbi:futalosine hydrolase [Bacillus sp. JCM 19034]|uniref:futalosine hydrolase n=1 Tax=Bacillus sp. JCM 19034 TaxID=1481928 RepID=UPI0007866B46|nr:futalosine hydrolase [Bacillus sp. JCM 19034]